MKVDNPFDRRLEAQTKMPTSLRDAAIHITDTLDVAWAAAQAVFEKDATPEHALTLLPLFLERADAERRQRAESILTGRAGAPAPAPAARKGRKAT
jgi:hypothetical protein